MANPFKLEYFIRLLSLLFLEFPPIETGITLGIAETEVEVAYPRGIQDLGAKGLVLLYRTRL